MTADYMTTEPAKMPQSPKANTPDRAARASPGTPLELSLGAGRGLLWRRHLLGEGATGPSAVWGGGGGFPLDIQMSFVGFIGINRDHGVCFCCVLVRWGKVHGGGVPSFGKPLLVLTSLTSPRFLKSQLFPFELV